MKDLQQDIKLLHFKLQVYSCQVDYKKSLTRYQAVTLQVTGIQLSCRF